eukprot:70268_1
MDHIQKYIPLGLKDLLIQIMNATFKSPHKYIRVLSATSSFFISWTISRWFYLHLRQKIFNYPPCHMVGIPWLGSIIYAFSPDLAEWDLKIATNNNPIISTRFGPNDSIMLNHIHLLKNPIYKDLIERKAIKVFKHPPDILLTSHYNWTKRRRLASNAFMVNLKSKHLNKGYAKILNTQIFPQLDKLNNKIYKTMKTDMSYLVFAMIYSTSFGHNAKVPKINDKIMKTFFDLNRAQSVSLLIALINGSMFGLTLANFFHHKVFNTLNAYIDLENITTQWIEEYEDFVCNNLKFNDSDNNYYIHNMLNHIKHNKLSRKEVIRDTMVLFVAGIDTTCSTIEAGFFWLTKYTNIQKRMFVELKIYKQNYGEFCLDHMNELNILRAFVYEVLRHNRILSHSFPRYIAESNVKIAGYNIPKGAYLIGNHFAINHSKKYWEKPNEFYIDHFLDKNGKFKMNKNICTFGIGMRNCMGQSLAVKNLYLLFGYLILRYKFEAENKSYIDSLNHIPTVGVGVKSIPVVIQRR